ncbi:hypothetical protein BATDEDRAFT_89441 [Batrachochytrium dendrobatidis JAM81]|uniref:BolA-like protein n=1 Tax=Batrachochytrium dendrobatidis (strain JAM81 / FGSC 10211) TaxID=684364 RepID=F4P4W8_BATDJ|nr:uncharacterized protein BATDEDRAFT_89441 [Batrachochytrium dendrobatidis JAM81]EGF79770.1 hypothetical protein BATDEDRAFT_89441 [Batrachochytrium dendrobatidis JAM81]KAJ8323180.1 hypothetical protein O5D80_007953 [Batrachochytrium dendrobatidis]KAK5672893.1 hypothetical protein QVD99_000378 [Batrachochytrium dendrobatidis]|eukprot:XP_006679670.1 hypothetical protein BATDEDRAFT_89441 [Batrachochytrium dendrobatidis JAM81]
MPVSKQLLESLLTEKLSPSHLEVIDTSNGCGQSFDVLVVSSLFEGKSVLQRHRLVNEAAKAEIAEIHAFSQKTYTPEQWRVMVEKQAAQESDQP